MAIGTFGALLDRLEDELRDTTINTQLREFVRTAIGELEYERFYFNEERSLSFTASTNAEFYGAADLAAIPNLLKIDSMRIAVSNQYYPLRRRDWSWMENVSQTATQTGTPTDYAYYNQRLRLWPIPNAKYTVQIASVVRLITLSATTDANAWVTEQLPEAIIRSRTKAHVWAHLKRDPGQAAFFNQIADTHLSQLRMTTTKRLSSGSFRPWKF